MREIGTNKSDVQLAIALRKLAEESAAAAPAELADALAGSFRRHHARRRAIRRVAAGSLAACLVLGLAVLKNKTAEPASVSRQAAMTARPQEQATANPQVQRLTPQSLTIAGATNRAAPEPRRRKPRPVRATPAVLTNASAQTQEFQALPAYNPTVRLEDTSVVRVEMPGSALRLVGAPMSAENAQRRVLADFVVGHDGTPYAVRLIAVRNTE